MELEYQDDDKNHEFPKYCPLPGEEDYLGIKSSSPPFFSSKKKVDRHFEMLEEEIMREFFKSDDYLQVKLGALPAAPTEVTKSCKCLESFYTEHSTCTWIFSSAFILIFYTNLTNASSLINLLQFKE